MTFSFDVKMCQFALLILNFVIVVEGCEFLLQTLTIITQWLLLKGLSEIIQDRVGCKEGDDIVRIVIDFEVPNVHVCLPPIRKFSWFLLIKF